MRSGIPDVGPAIAISLAKRVRVEGLVQGVGFRPFVHRLVIQRRLNGWVRNTSGAVEIHVEGEASAIDRFLLDLRDEAPVLARIESIAAVTAVRTCCRYSASASQAALPGPFSAPCCACSRRRCTVG